MEELWRNILGFEGYYQVSNLGRVKCMDRDICYSNGKVHHHKSRLLKFSKNQNGYLLAHLQKQGINRCVAVHKLVAMHFVDGYADGLQVNHKDENKLNNRADNLEWCTQVYNINYGTGRKRMVESYKKDVYTKRTKLLAVYKDGEPVGEYNGYKEVGMALGITLEYASQIANGRKHKHYIIIQKRPRSYPIGQFLDGKLVAVYPSITKAGEAIGKHSKLIVLAADSGKPYHGYTWKRM